MVAALALAVVVQSRPEPDWLPVLDAPKNLTHELAIAPPKHPGPKLEVRGTLTRSDGKTPAAGVILYVHHTDARGLYPAGESATGWTRWHGTLRGWLKTNAQGHYVLKTTRPAPYPGGTEPAHIHVYGVEEGSRSGIMFPDILFAGDRLINQAYWDRVGRFGTRPYAGMQLRERADGVLVGRWDLKMPR